MAITHSLARRRTSRYTVTLFPPSSAAASPNTSSLASMRRYSLLELRRPRPTCSREESRKRRGVRGQPATGGDLQDGDGDGGAKLRC